MIGYASLKWSFDFTYTMFYDLGMTDPYITNILTIPNIMEKSGVELRIGKNYFQIFQAVGNLMMNKTLILNEQDTVSLLCNVVGIFSSKLYSLEESFIVIFNDNH
jgi:hypothetical protein